MNDALARIAEEPILLAVLIFLLGGLVFGLMKRVLKLAFIFVLGFLALGGWFVYTGQEPPEAMKRITRGASEKLEQGAELGREKAREVGERLGEEIKEAAKKTLDESLGAGAGN